MSTLTDLKSYIDGLPSFPASRTSQVYYGNTDATVRPLVLFSDLDQSFDQRSTCGRVLADGTFQVHVLTDPATGSLEEAEDISEQVDALLDGQQVTPSTTLCSLERYQVLTEPVYVFHVVRTYRLQESI